MDKKLSFTKMQGIGNDFIVVDDFFPALRGAGGEVHEAPLTAELARRMCDRRFGIGADQILWLKAAKDPKQADVRMEILNADGSRAEMCGNGIRAAAVYFHERIPEQKTHYLFETEAGIKGIEVYGRRVTVDMGAPRLGAAFSGEPENLDLGAGALLPFYEVSMGNPHAVFFVKDLSEPLPGETVEALGPRIETHPRFPERTNVEFVQVETPESIRVRVWERGAGITLACGTGACASAVASLATGRVKGSITVHLPGGDLVIRWAGGESSVFMEGPAEEVFSGEYPLEG